MKNSACYSIILLSSTFLLHSMKNTSLVAEQGLPLRNRSHSLPTEPINTQNSSSTRINNQSPGGEGSSNTRGSNVIEDSFGSVVLNVPRYSKEFCDHVRACA